jgi:hypothetical protein
MEKFPRVTWESWMLDTLGNSSLASIWYHYVTQLYAVKQQETRKYKMAMTQI